MHKMFYASGFIYNLSSKQILLQQLQSSSPLMLAWLLFEKEHAANEQPEIVFRKTINQLLGIVIDTINPIYSYFDEITYKDHSLLYATINTLQEFPTKHHYSFRWFSFKEVPKLQIAEQMKHDIVVGQRVIEAAGRRERGEHTLQ